MRRALVLTISDGVSAGARDDASGREVGTRLAALDFAVDRALVADDRPVIQAA